MKLTVAEIKQFESAVVDLEEFVDAMSKISTNVPIIGARFGISKLRRFVDKLMQVEVKVS